MKIAFLADVHWGIGNDSSWQTDRLEGFFNTTFIPYISEKSNNISDVVVLGDWFDRRKYINFRTLQKSKKILARIIDSVPGNVWFIVGNHDTYYKSTVELNSIEELFSELDVNIVSKPTDIVVNGKKILMVPWIVPETAEEYTNLISNSDADVCCGHFELKGAKMMDNIVCQNGYSFRLFDHFDHVFTGHFHKPSNNGHCYYVGSPLQFTWNDYGDAKRIMYYDTETGDRGEFLTNDVSFIKIYYNDQNFHVIPEIQDFSGKNIKIIVESKANPYDFEGLLTSIDNDQPFKVDVIEQYLYQPTAQDSSEILDKDTLSIMMDSVDDMDIPDKDRYRSKLLVKSLYSEALQRDNIS